MPVSHAAGSVYGSVKNFARVLGALCALCLICLPLFSQTTQGTIQGGVFDQTGGAIAGATVTRDRRGPRRHANLDHRWRRTVRRLTT